MKLVFFAHPPFSQSTSMPRFLRMLTDGMRERGHSVEIWAPRPFWHNLPAPAIAKKWLGYADQFVSFPAEVKSRLERASPDTLFVFCDQALGPWVPLVAHRPHVVHCHDFLALGSALGEWPQNPVSWTGRNYQALIRRGFSRADNFVSVSAKTQEDLHRFLPRRPRRSIVVYNGLNYPFKPLAPIERLPILESLGIEVPPGGFILHVGGNQWYKNRAGVVEIYNHYAARTSNPLPLWMLGAAPPAALRNLAMQSVNGGGINFITNASDLQVNAAYSHARALLFASTAEGFGWPIAEAMAAGCLVLTTPARPMSEVGGEAAVFLPTRDAGTQWSAEAAGVLRSVLEWPEDKVERQKRLGIEQALKFSGNSALSAYERFYLQILTET